MPGKKTYPVRRFVELENDGFFLFSFFHWRKIAVGDKRGARIDLLFYPPKVDRCPFAFKV